MMKILTLITIMIFSCMSAFAVVPETNLKTLTLEKLNYCPDFPECEVECQHDPQGCPDEELDKPPFKIAEQDPLPAWCNLYPQLCGNSKGGRNKLEIPDNLTVFDNKQIKLSKLYIDKSQCQTKRCCDAAGGDWEMDAFGGTCH